jgi:hemerythrin superfamily protein
LKRYPFKELPMDAITMLKKQHDEVDALFHEIEGAEDADEKERLFIQIADALAMHATIEEKIFYPAVRAERTEDILLEALEEHLGIKRVLADLLGIESDDETFDAKIKVLQEQVEHHVKEEEDDLFPKVKRIFDKERLEELAAEMQAMTRELEKAEPRNHIPAEIDSAPTLH